MRSTRDGVRSQNAERSTRRNHLDEGIVRMHAGRGNRRNTRLDGRRLGGHRRFTKVLGEPCRNTMRISTGPNQDNSLHRPLRRSGWNVV